MTTKPLHLDVNEQIECAHTLASRFYTDPHILEIEREKIFRRTWQLVGTLDRPCGEVNGVKRTIADPESYFTADVAGEPVLVVRDKKGALRAFSNVCRHRAGPIALGSGCKNVLRCQYHGWTYTLDGRLIGTPDVEGVEFFDRSTMGMIPLQVETWEKFIFVNFEACRTGKDNAETQSARRPSESFFSDGQLTTEDGKPARNSGGERRTANGEQAPASGGRYNGTAPSLAEVLGKIPEQARGFQFAGLQFAERRDYVINCNWKVYVDNYLEGYHIPIAHPGLMREIDYAQYRTDTYRYYSQQFAPIRAAGGQAGTRKTTASDDSGERIYAPGTGLQEALYFWVFPNLMLNIYPDNISTNVIVPLSTEKTLTIFEWFFHDVDSPKTKERIAKAVAFSDEVQQEDIVLCENVQKGLRSSTYDRGRYSVKRENGVHHFHTLLAEFLGEGGAMKKD
jgi:choline monooxygenase